MSGRGAAGEQGTEGRQEQTNKQADGPGKANNCDWVWDWEWNWESGMGMGSEGMWIGWWVRDRDTDSNCGCESMPATWAQSNQTRWAEWNFNLMNEYGNFFFISWLALQSVEVWRVCRGCRPWGTCAFSFHRAQEAGQDTQEVGQLSAGEMKFVRGFVISGILSKDQLVWNLDCFLGAIAFSVFNYKSCLTGEPASACWLATFKFRVRLTMSFIITRLAVSLLDSTFVPRRVYKFLCLFSLCFLRMCVFSFYFHFYWGHTHNLRIWHPKEVPPRVECVCCGFLQGTFRMCGGAHTHVYICHE